MHLTFDDKVSSTFRPELEVRFGMVNENGWFVPGVSKEFMEQIVATCDSFPEWTKVNPWEETQDFFYSFDGNDVRTTVYYDMKTMQMQQVHISKTILDKRTVKCMVPEKRDPQRRRSTCPECKQPIRQPAATAANHQNGSSSRKGTPSSTTILKPYYIRVSSAIENEICKDRIPSHVMPSHVRIKKRKSYYYRPYGSTAPLWVFDLTESYNGATHMECETKQRLRQEPVYEVECECLSTTEYRNAKKETMDHLILSMFMKLLDFFVVTSDEDDYTVANMDRLIHSLSMVDV
jgi:hypothetical protein